MNATSHALRGYATNAASTRSDRRTEYEAIARITKSLRETAMKAKTDYPAYVEALNLNERLWTALIVDIANADNPLPVELKARLAYLGDFTRHHTRKVLRENASVMPLLEINMAILRGLKLEGPGK